MNSMFRIALIAAPAALLAPGAGHAQAMKCIDAAGKTVYTNKPEPGQKCSPVGGNLTVVPAGPAGTAPAIPKAQPDTGRRKALEAELAAAENELAAARTALAEQEAVRYGDERNYQRVLDRLKPYQDRVAQQEQSVARLKDELSRLR